MIHWFVHCIRVMINLHWFCVWWICGSTCICMHGHKSMCICVHIVCAHVYNQIYYIQQTLVYKLPPRILCACVFGGFLNFSWHPKWSQHYFLLNAFSLLCIGYLSTPSLCWFFLRFCFFLRFSTYTIMNYKQKNIYDADFDWVSWHSSWKYQVQSVLVVD